MEESLKNIEDFLLNEDFRSWVQNPTPELDNRWGDYVKNNPDKAKILSQAKGIISSLEFKQYPSNTETRERILHNIKSETKDWNTSRQLRFSIPQYWARIAAILILSVSLSYLLFYFTNNDKPVQAGANIIKKENPLGVRSHYILSDGTEVFLNAGSSISFPRNFTGKDRVVNLNGEAYFEVKSDKNRPFKVVSDRLSVSVLGTKFNFNTTFETNAVALVEGKVKYSNDRLGEEVILRPGQMASYNETASEFMISDFDADVMLGWKDGNLVFQDASLEQVIDGLNKWYGVSVEVENIGSSQKWSYTASFRNESLETVLLNMSTVKDFTYEISDHQVTISF